jgi:hypothetical protein
MSGKHRTDGFKKAPGGGAGRGGNLANFRQATDIEDAAHAINEINARTRREALQEKDYARRKITLPSQYDEWLKKEIP